MRASAILLAALGAGATFLPDEILVRSGVAPMGFSVVLVQIAGALYLGFAFLNWMAQGNAIGGIYSRPVAVGNVGHFTIAGLALVKSMIAGQHDLEIVLGTMAYVVFAVLFAIIAFGRPPSSPGSQHRNAGRG